MLPKMLKILEIHHCVELFHFRSLLLSKSLYSSKRTETNSYKAKSLDNVFILGPAGYIEKIMTFRKAVITNSILKILSLNDSINK